MNPCKSKWMLVLCVVAALTQGHVRLHAQTLAEALDTPTWTWSGDWWVDNFGYFEGAVGGSCAGAGAGLGGSEVSTEVVGPGLLTFHHASYFADSFEFIVDFAFATQLPESYSFAPFTISIPAGRHYLTWQCDSGSFGEAALDNVSFVPVSLPTLNEGLDTSGWTWVTGGSNWVTGETNGGWVGELGSRSHDGVDAATAALVGYPYGYGGEAWIQTTVTGPGRLSFYFCAPFYWYSSFIYTVDGQYQNNLNHYEWQPSSVIVGPGSHVVRWELVTGVDPWGYPGFAEARLDQVTFGPPTVPEILQQPQSLSRDQGGNASFAVSVFGAEPMTYQWRLNSTNIAGATNLALTVTNVQLADAGAYALWASNSFGTTLSSNAVLTVQVIPPSIIVNDGSMGFGPEGFGFNLSGAAGTMVIVEGSTNLADWLPLQTNLLDGSPASFSDQQYTNYPGRYYRLRLQ